MWAAIQVSLAPMTTGEHGWEQRVERRGDLRLHLWSASGLPEALREGLVRAGLERRGQRDGGGVVELEGRTAWVKGGRLTGGSAWRHGLRRALLGRPFPRQRELANLTWLRARGLAAVEPLVAGLGWRGVRPVLQFLGTSLVPDAPSLAELAGDPEVAPERLVAAAAAAGRLLAELHVAGFTHRDAFARNFIVDAGGSARVLDTWRGGPGRRIPAVGAARDLADFEGDAEGLLPAEALAAFRSAYAT